MKLYNFKAKVLNIVDGDTIDVEIKVGFHITTTQRLRLLRINTSELRSKDEHERKIAYEAKEFVEKKLLDKDVYIHTEKEDSFGRYLAEVYVEDREVFYSFNDLLLSNGLAKRYKD